MYICVTSDSEDEVDGHIGDRVGDVASVATAVNVFHVANRQAGEFLCHRGHDLKTVVSTNRYKPSHLNHINVTLLNLCSIHGYLHNLFLYS